MFLSLSLSLWKRLWFRMTSKNFISTQNLTCYANDTRKSLSLSLDKGSSAKKKWARLSGLALHLMFWHSCACAQLRICQMATRVRPFSQEIVISPLKLQKCRKICGLVCVNLVCAPEHESCILAHIFSCRSVEPFTRCLQFHTNWIRMKKTKHSKAKF